MRDAHYAVPKGIEIATDERSFDSSVQCCGELSTGSAARNAHAAYAVAIEFGPGFYPVQRAHHAPDAPTDHRLAQQERGPRGGLASETPPALPLGDLAPAIPERDRLDRHCRHSVLN